MGEEDGSVVDLDAQRKGKCAVIKTSTRQASYILLMWPSKFFYLILLSFKAKIIPLIWVILNVSCIYLQTYFLPVIGLVDAEKLKPGDLVGVNKDSYLILETLPAEYDARVKAMEVDERPTEQYSDIGGLDKQIQEVCILSLRTGLKYKNSQFYQNCKSIIHIVLSCFAAN